MQNPITHAVLASKLQLEGDENPYVKQINADELPESLKQKEKRQSKNSEWVFTVQGESQEKNLKSIIAEVQEVKKFVIHSFYFHIGEKMWHILTVSLDGEH